MWQPYSWASLSMIVPHCSMSCKLLGACWWATRRLDNGTVHGDDLVQRCIRQECSGHRECNDLLQASTADGDEVDSEAGSSDAEEDADAKVQRLREAAAASRRRSGQAATTSRPGQSLGKPKKGGRARRPLSIAGEAEAAGQEEQPRGGIAVMTDGPLSVDHDPAGQAAEAAGQLQPDGAAGMDVDQADGVLAQVARQQGSMRGRAHLFTSDVVPNRALLGRQRKRKNASGVAVSIGSAAATAVGSATSAAAPARAATEPAQAVFEPAMEFCGARPGYTFGNGDQGVGYYLDMERQVLSNGNSGKKQRAAASRQEGNGGVAAAIAAVAVADEASPTGDDDADMQPAAGRLLSAPGSSPTP